MIRPMLTLSLAALLFQATTGVSCVAQTKASPQKAFHYDFKARQAKSKAYWQVVLPIDDNPASALVILNIVSNVPGWPMEKRAEAIAERMNELESNDSNWYKDIVPDRMKDEEVVKSTIPTSDVQWVMTADRNSVGRWNVKSPKELAYKIIKELQDKFNNSRVQQALHGKGSVLAALQEREKTSIDWFEEAAAYQEDGRKAPAQFAYQKAIALDNTYVEAYIRLAQIYRDQNHLTLAKEQLDAAQKYSPLPDQVQMINTLQKDIDELLKSPSK